MTTLGELKKQVFKAENPQNFLSRDGEGWSFPYKVQEFATLDTNGSEFGWVGVSKCLFGQGPIEFRQIAPFDGDGGTATFTGGTFAERLNPLNCSVIATIGAAIKGWTDTNGTKQIIADRVLAYGDGLDLVFQAWCGTASVEESTFILKHVEGGVPRTATSAAGVISGTNIASGTLDPITGEVNVTFTAAPDDGTAISVDYTVDSFMDLEHSEILSSANGIMASFGALQTDFVGIRDYSVRITAVIGGIPRYFVDDGAGTLVGLTAGTLTSGSVDQATGAIVMTFASAPSDGSNISITYCRTGLNKSVIDYTTGTGIDLRFDVGYEPDNSTKVIIIASAYAITESVGSGVTTGLLSIGYVGKRAGFRTSRNYRDVGSEDYAGDKAAIRSVPGERHVMSFYSETSSGTAKCLIRAWAGTATNTQVSIGGSSLEWGALTGEVARVVDPDDGSKFCLECSITPLMSRFGVFVSGPVGAYCLSMEWIGDVTCTYTGEQSLWVSGIAVGTGTALGAYSPNAANFSLQRPRSNPNGVAGQVPVADGKGGFTWSDPSTASGSGISQLNGLSAGVQTFAVGTGGTAPAFASGGSTHTLNIPLASTPAVTAGLISKSDYDKFNAGTSGSNTVSLVPTINDSIDIGTSNFNWRSIYGIEGRFNFLGDRTKTGLNGGALDLAQYLQGNGALTLGYNAYDTNVSGATRSVASNAGFLVNASGSNLTISMTEPGEAETNTGVTSLELNASHIVVGRASKAWSANRLTDVGIKLLHPILSDYPFNFSSPQYDANSYPLFTVRGVQPGLGKGPVIAFARAESATLPIGAIWCKPKAAGSGLDKIVFMGSSNDTSWPTSWAEIGPNGFDGSLMFNATTKGSVGTGPVFVNSAGLIEETGPNKGDQAQFTTGGILIPTVVPISATKALVLYKDVANGNAGTCRVATINKRDITYGPATIFHEGVTEYISAAKFYTSGNVVYFAVAYYASAMARAELRTINVALSMNDEIALGYTAAIFCNSSTGYIKLMHIPTYAGDMGAIVYQDNGDTGIGKIVGFSIDTPDFPELSSSVPFSGTVNATYIDADILSVNGSLTRVVISYRDGTAGYCMAVMSQLNQYSPSLYGGALIALSQACSYICVNRISDSRFLLTLRVTNENNTCQCQVIRTNNGMMKGTFWTPVFADASRYQSVTMLTQTEGIIAYQDVNGQGAATVSHFTIRGTNIDVADSYQISYSTHNCYYTTIAALDKNKAIAVWMNATDANKGYSIIVVKQRVDGYCKAYGFDATVPVQKSGVISPASGGGDAGTEVYVNAIGNVEYFTYARPSGIPIGTSLGNNVLFSKWEKGDV